ncbi:MAG: hypothetical protein ACRDRL_08235, partial [Sciscionella sp.]
GQLGLVDCPVCTSGGLAVHRYPMIGLVGDLPPSGRRSRDTGSTIDFFVRIECKDCGHTLLFNSARFGDSQQEIADRVIDDGEQD